MATDKIKSAKYLGVYRSIPTSLMINEDAPSGMFLGQRTGEGSDSLPLLSPLVARKLKYP